VHFRVGNQEQYDARLEHVSSAATVQLANSVDGQHRRRATDNQGGRGNLSRTGTGSMLRPQYDNKFCTTPRADPVHAQRVASW
jgi:hypothetical protein